MIFKLLCFMVVLCLHTVPSSGSDYTTARSTSPVKVMSLNLRTTLANDPCPSGCWRQRKDRIRQMLDEYQPDLIGTQEGAPDQIAFIQHDLGYASVGECAGDCQWNERDSIFYSPKRWSLLETKTYALSDTPDVIPSNTWGLQYLRTLVLARFQDHSSGHVVCMLNTHYDITKGQLESSLLVANQLDRFCKEDDVVVMTGDLNAPPSSAAVQYLLNETQLSGHYTPMPLYETLTEAGAGGPTWIGPSFGSQVAGDKIDYILSRHDDCSCVRNATVILDTFGGYSVSDHAAVQTEFCLGSGCSGCRDTN